MVWFTALMSPVVAALMLDTQAMLPGALSAVVFALLITAIGYPLLMTREDSKS